MNKDNHKLCCFCELPYKDRVGLHNYPNKKAYVYISDDSSCHMECYIGYCLEFYFMKMLEEMKEEHDT